MENDQLQDLLYSRSYCGVFERMRSANPDVSIREVLQSLHSIRGSDIVITPIQVLEFVREVLEQTGCKKLYIPFARGVDVETFCQWETVVDYHAYNSELGNLIQMKTGISSVSEDSGFGSAYDIIFSDIPFGPIHKGCIQKQIVEGSIERLAPNGLAVFTFANNIVFGTSSKKWLEELSSKGFYVSAIVDLPEGMYKPVTPIGSKIIVFAKQRLDKLFLAKLQRETDAAAIVKNYLTKTNSSKAKSLGLWVDHNTFPDYSAHENEQRRIRTAQKLEKAYNGKVMPISQVSTAINALKRKGALFEEAENAIYIPKTGKSEVATNLNELQVKPENSYQILVDQEKMLPEFLKFFLNSDSGITNRMRAMIGLTVPALTPDRVQTIDVPVPSLKVQEAVLSVYAELSQIELAASRLKGRLEDIPAAYSNIAKEIKDINNKGNKFEQWIETLPYPLATILKRYTAADTFQQRQEMLFYFFEAYSIFVAAIMLAVFQQPQFNASTLEDVGVDYFEKASFGSWVKMDRAIAKCFRARMDNPGSMDAVLNSFHTDDQSLVKLISLGDVYSILQRTCDCRNSWKGHSGITSEAIYNDHVRVLEGELYKLQDRLKDLYEKIRLVRPIGLKRRSGEFINKVEVLTGSNPIFKKTEIIGEPLDEEQLYIQVVDTGETLEVPPLFVLKNSPADVKNACYFYNRVEGSNSRYVSYHFEGKPEDIEEGETAFDIIKAVLTRGYNN